MTLSRSLATFAWSFAAFSRPRACALRVFMFSAGFATSAECGRRGINVAAWTSDDGTDRVDKALNSLVGSPALG